MAELVQKRVVPLRQVPARLGERLERRFVPLTQWTQDLPERVHHRRLLVLCKHSLAVVELQSVVVTVVT